VGVDALAVAAALIGFEHADGIEERAAGEGGEPGGEGALAAVLETGEADDRLGVGLLHDIVEGEEGLPAVGDGVGERCAGEGAVTGEEVGEGLLVTGLGAGQEGVIACGHGGSLQRRGVEGGA
jgi:hypothetical protein